MRSSLLFVSMVACASADGDSNVRAKPAERGPLVLELFTSQGCSSCPPAERVLSKLAKDPSLAPLAFHVDYWDGLGWQDPFAAPAWTERQQAYSRVLADSRVYTPELVVGGAVGMVGSNTDDIQRALERAERPARLEALATWLPAALEVSATAPADAEVYVAVWQDGLSTAVAHGENAGATLASDRVVRKLERVATPGTRGILTIPLDPSWRAGGAVVFAQRSDKRIVASALLTR